MIELYLGETKDYQINIHMRLIDIFEAGPNIPAMRYKDWRKPGRVLDYKNKTPVEMLVLTSDGGAVRFYWGDHNTMSWDQVYTKARAAMDPSIQRDITQISLFRTGYILNPYTDNSKWAGRNNRYSSAVRNIAKSLLDRGLANTDTPIWLGNWAARNGESIGSVGKILARPENPKRLFLYHGTNNYRLAKIMRDGLKPLDISKRVWKDSKAPDHRNESIYLTADRSQAEYYASKSVNVDKARGGRKREYWADPDWPDRLEPVLILVQLGTNDMKRLKADDDFLQQKPDADPSDWRSSLENFSQIAFTGSIPPNRIRIIPTKM